MTKRKKAEGPDADENALVDAAGDSEALTEGESAAADAPPVSEERRDAQAEVAKARSVLADAEAEHERARSAHEAACTDLERAQTAKVEAEHVFATTGKGWEGVEAAQLAEKQADVRFRHAKASEAQAAEQLSRATRELKAAEEAAIAAEHSFPAMRRRLTPMLLALIEQMERARELAAEIVKITEEQRRAAEQHGGSFRPLPEGYARTLANRLHGQGEPVPMELELRELLNPFFFPPMRTRSPSPNAWRASMLERLGLSGLGFSKLGPGLLGHDFDELVDAALDGRGQEWINEFRAGGPASLAKPGHAGGPPPQRSPTAEQSSEHDEHA